MLVVFLLDGKLVVLGLGDKIVRLWDAVMGAALQTLEDHWDWVWSVAFSPDGKLVVSGSDDGTVRLWDAVTGAALQTLEGHWSSVTSVAFSLDGKPYDSVTLETLSDSLEQLHCLSVLNDWVVESSRNILWLPSDYRATCVAIWNGIVMLGHSSGSISFLKFKQGSKLI
jgi:WD40 repeat protein